MKHARTHGATARCKDESRQRWLDLAVCIVLFPLHLIALALMRLM